MAGDIEYYFCAMAQKCKQIENGNNDAATDGVPVPGDLKIDVVPSGRFDPIHGNNGNKGATDLYADLPLRVEWTASSVRRLLMKRCGSILLAGLALMLMSGCTAKLMQPEWKYEKEAIQVHVQADHQLNLYNSKAHTLYVCFYQLSELNTFDQLTQDEPGIRKLLECKLFDSSVAAVNSKVIHAGETSTFFFDRAERAQYFAIVTGYFDKLDDARMVRRHKIQVFKKRESFWKQKYRCVPCVLEIDMALGPKQIEYSKIIVKDKACKDDCK